MHFHQALESIVSGQNLDAGSMRDVMREIMSGNTTDAQMGAFLVALRIKGESIDEITGAVEVMRELATALRFLGITLLILWALGVMNLACLMCRQLQHLSLPPPAGGSQNMGTGRSAARVAPQMCLRPRALILV